LSSLDFTVLVLGLIPKWENEENAALAKCARMGQTKEKNKGAGLRRPPLQRQEKVIGPTLTKRGWGPLRVFEFL
jgi:hypothetical protein